MTTGAIAPEPPVTSNPTPSPSNLTEIATKQAQWRTMPLIPFNNQASFC